MPTALRASASSTQTCEKWSTECDYSTGIIQNDYRQSARYPRGLNLQRLRWKHSVNETQVLLLLTLKRNENKFTRIRSKTRQTQICPQTLSLRPAEEGSTPLDSVSQTSTRSHAVRTCTGPSSSRVSPRLRKILILTIAPYLHRVRARTGRGKQKGRLWTEDLHRVRQRTSRGKYTFTISAHRFLPTEVHSLPLQRS